MYLSFISDENLIKATEKVINTITTARNRPDSQLFKNAVDPFSGLFDSAIQNIEIKDWLGQEKSRQVQKTFQNAIGSFHQDIIGAMPGWENLEVGNVFDVRHKNKKCVAEIKNKHNTTKGNHRVRVYDDLKSTLSLPEYSNYTAYLVEVLPKNRKAYNIPFTPSDNQTHKKRAANKKIRLVSGQLFYDLASGEKNSLKKLFIILPKIIETITGVSQKKITTDINPLYLFEKAY